LAVLGGTAGYGLALSGLYVATGVALPCPFRMLTGWQCPLCGGTRLGGALLHGDVAAAFGYNPVVLVALVAVTLLGVLWTVELLGGPAVRPPPRVRAVLCRFGLNLWLALALLTGAVYVVLRNLL
jgi:hypothetical protein